MASESMCRTQAIVAELCDIDNCPISIRQLHTTIVSLLPPTAERAIQLHHRQQLLAIQLRQRQLTLK